MVKLTTTAVALTTSVALFSVGSGVPALQLRGANRQAHTTSAKKLAKAARATSKRVGYSSESFVNLGKDDDASTFTSATASSTDPASSEAEAGGLAHQSAAADEIDPDCIKQIRDVAKSVSMPEGDFQRLREKMKTLMETYGVSSPENPYVPYLGKDNYGLVEVAKAVNEASPYFLTVAQFSELIELYRSLQKYDHQLWVAERFRSLIFSLSVDAFRYKYEVSTPEDHKYRVDPMWYGRLVELPNLNPESTGSDWDWIKTLSGSCKLESESRSLTIEKLYGDRALSDLRQLMGGEQYHAHIMKIHSLSRGAGSRSTQA